MANRYNFASIAGSVSDEMKQLLLERRAQEQQAFLNRIKEQEMAQQAENARRADEFLKLQQDQFGAGLADKVYEDLMPGDQLDANTAALLRKYGRGGGLQDSGLGIAGEARLNPKETPEFEITKPLSQSDMGALDTALTGSISDLNPQQTKRTVAPGVIFSERGGPKYAAARVAAQERADQAKAAAQSREDIAEANRQAQNERAKESNEMKLLIAQLARSGNAQSQALANELKQLQIDALRGKQTDAQDAKGKAEASAQSATQTAYDLAARLKTHPGLPKASGIVSSRVSGFSQEATDANAIRGQLVAALALPNLGLLKGPMSDKDVIFVKQLATRLADETMSDAETIRAINEAMAFLESKGAVRPQSGLQPFAPASSHGPTRQAAPADNNDPMGIRKR